MPHLKIGTKVRVKNYCEAFDGEIGVILCRNGEYYTVELLNLYSDMRIVSLYLCEMEVICSTQV